MDDLPDGGASHIAETVREVKSLNKDILVECLVPDFQGNLSAVETVAMCGLDVYAHNIETIERLTPFVRDRRAQYKQSLSTLKHVKLTLPRLVTKSSIMVGLGESFDEIVKAMQDLRDVGVDCLTLGQYMQPTKRHLIVQEYVTPATFDRYKEAGEQLGFLYVASGPLVRSSYRAAEFYLKNILTDRRKQSQASSL